MRKSNVHYTIEVYDNDGYVLTINVNFQEYSRNVVFMLEEEDGFLFFEGRKIVKIERVEIGFDEETMDVKHDIRRIF